MKQLYFSLTIMALANAGPILAATEAKADDAGKPEVMILGYAVPKPAADHPKIPLSGSTSLAAAKADDAEPLLADISRAADAETAYLWQQSRKTRANIYRREHKLADLHHGVGRKAGFRDLDPETNRAMKQATEGGRVIQMLRAEIAFTSAADAKKLEQQVTRGYRKWRAANPDTPLILRSMAGEWRPSVIGEKPGLSVRTLLYFGEE